MSSAKPKRSKVTARLGALLVELATCADDADRAARETEPTDPAARLSYAYGWLAANASGLAASIARELGDDALGAELRDRVEQMDLAIDNRAAAECGRPAAPPAVEHAIWTQGKGG